ncbi:DUF3054 domain-containing protein [Microbacterium sp. bgisy207]|jgi:hypothetical protein|uniref:DUF3054 domain-containing protein n=1 Tax=Microbacterium sp. bgisy207 TaxID=3413800 RepID=UPI003EBAC04B
MSSTPGPLREAAVTPSPRIVAAALAIDVALVVVFAAIGRASHGEDVIGVDGLGLAQTSWPFLVSLLAGWLAMRLWRFPLAILGAGVAVWLYTVIGGMLLRAISGQGVQTAFVIVASIVLALFLVGWRVVVALITRIRARRSESLVD